MAQHLPIRLERSQGPSIQSWKRPAGPLAEGMQSDAVVDCGWGRLIFAHTFADDERLLATLRAEAPKQRDIAFYVRDPHVLVANAPQELFLSPSHTYRLWLDRYQPATTPPAGFTVGRLASREDAEAISNIYRMNQMVSVEPEFIWEHRADPVLTYLVAKSSVTGDVLGTISAVDHDRAFADPERGGSFWTLSVHPQTRYPGVGEALVRGVIEVLQARGLTFVDCSVLHDNAGAIALYDKLGFQRVPAFSVKAKNALNEPLFTGPPPEENLNRYADEVIREALRRGIHVEVLDREAGFFQLSSGGRWIDCHESLTGLTNAVALSRCRDLDVCRRLLARAGLQVPAWRLAGTRAQNEAFLAEHGPVVVKPRWRQAGCGVTVDVRTPDELTQAVEAAQMHAVEVVIEELVPGTVLRILVIDGRVVAGAVRLPPQVTGTGEHRVRDLIERLSRRRSAATGGESQIPIDEETDRCVREEGWDLDAVLPTGEVLTLRKTANLRTGATIEDVTADLSPALIEAAQHAAQTLDVPVVGLDLIVPAVDGPDYRIIRAEERPGLAHHEPQPVIERFLDLLFPHTAARADG